MVIKSVSTRYESNTKKGINKNTQKRKLREELLRMGFTFSMGAIALGKWQCQAKHKITDKKDTFKIEIYDNADYDDWKNLLKKSKYKWIVKLFNDDELEKFVESEAHEC